MTLSGVLNSIGLIGYVTFLVHPARTRTRMGRDKRERDDKGGDAPKREREIDLCQTGHVPRVLTRGLDVH